MTTGDYCTLVSLKRELWPDDTTPDALNDDQLARVITQVSRDIDAYTGTSFYDAGADEIRYFTAHCGGVTCRIDPATAITSVATDHGEDRTYSYVWSDSDWEAWPYNSGAHRGQPYARIDTTPHGRYGFPTAPRAVKVTARFCYHAAATPAATLADIQTVALLKAVRMFKRKDAPFGILSVGDAGIAYVPGFDPDEKRILDAYKVNYT